jgi:hypothetical protein
MQAARQGWLSGQSRDQLQIDVGVPRIDTGVYLCGCPARVSLSEEEAGTPYEPISPHS